MADLTKFLKEIVARVYVYTGAHYFLMKMLDKYKVTIVVYHDPNPESFRAHLEYLSKNHTFISLNTLAEALRRKDWSGIPPHSVVVTFDDGNKSNHGLLKLLKMYRVTPTVYVCSHIVDTHRHFWWKNDGIDVRKLKRYPFDVMTDRLRYQAGFELEREYPDRQALCRFELEEMSPFVDFGSHTRFHPILTNCGDERCLKEIADSKIFLEGLLNRSIEHFAYPNGDYEEREIGYLKQSGYLTGRTLDVGRNSIHADPSRLKAIAIEDDASLPVFRAQLSGLFGYLKYARYRSFRGLRPPLL